MSRSRYGGKKRDPPNFWETGRTDRTWEPFAKLTHSLMQHPAFCGLNLAARWLYLACCVEAKGQRDFKFSRGTAARCYGISDSSFSRGMAELQLAGFIVRLDDAEHSQFAAALYRFVEDWKSTSAPRHGGG